jgi:hypothetical protein
VSLQRIRGLFETDSIADGRNYKAGKSTRSESFYFWSIWAGLGGVGFQLVICNVHYYTFHYRYHHLFRSPFCSNMGMEQFM